MDMFAKSVFSGEFPLTAQFRSGPRGDKPSYDLWKGQQLRPEGYAVDLQTNVLRFSPNNYEYANEFARENPNMLILSTWRAASGAPKGAEIDGDPLGESVISFPGHFIYSPGSTLASDASATSKTMTVESGENMIKGPALLVETTSSGEMKWDRFEYILIKNVNGNKLTIERAFNGSPAPRDFPGGRTYVAPMPWDDRNRVKYTDWFFNFSEFCPEDDQGKTAMDVVFEDMLYPLAIGGPLEYIGGLDLASGPLTVNPNNADYDLDGIADTDSIYRAGVKTFYERVRDVLGPSRVLTTSLDYEFVELINGVNQEGLANPDDPWEEVTRTVNDVLAWKRLSVLPMASIVFSQYYNNEEDLLRVQLQRLLNGYSVCLGLAADVENGSSSEALDALKRIELYKGDEKEAHWLGRALGMQRTAAMTPNLLNSAQSPTEWDAMLPALSILRATLFVDGDELVIRPNAGDWPGYVTLDLHFNLSKKTDFTVFMEARSDDDQLFRKILLPRVSVAHETGPVRAAITGKDYLPLSFYVRGAEEGSVTMDFRFGEGGDIRVKSLSVHAAPDAFACEFERGVVLVNPSLEDISFDLTNIFPERNNYNRLLASEPDSNLPDKYKPQLKQAMEMNNGRSIRNPESLEVGQRNALFLIADDVTAPRPPSQDPFRGAPVPSTAAPTSSPTSSVTFEITEGVFVSCSWTERMLTDTRCKKSTVDGILVKDLCPEVCENVAVTPQAPTQAPITKPSDTSERFEIKQDNFVGCNWAKRKKTNKRCKKFTVRGNAVKDLCPEVCK